MEPHLTSAPIKPAGYYLEASRRRIGTAVCRVASMQRWELGHQL